MALQGGNETCGFFSFSGSWLSDVIPQYHQILVFFIFPKRLDRIGCCISSSLAMGYLFLFPALSFSSFSRVFSLIWLSMLRDNPKGLYPISEPKSKGGNRVLKISAGTVGNYRKSKCLVDVIRSLCIFRAMARNISVRRTKRPICVWC